MSNILIIKHGSLGDLIQANGAIQDIKNNFQGKENQNLPKITGEIISDVSNRYIELFNLITGNTFKPRNSNNILRDLENNITDYLT